MPLLADLQSSTNTSGWVELFILDCSNIGGSIHHFTPNIYPDGSLVEFQGETYQHLPIQMQGWEVVSTNPTSGNNTQPQPIVSLSNVSKVMLSSIISLGNIIGATFTRMRTFEKYLDGQAEADTTQFIGPDVYLVAQKTTHTNTTISWQLSTLLDQPGKMLPARQYLKDSVNGWPNFPGLNPYRNR